MITLRELANLKKALVGSPFKLHYRTEFQGIPISIENRRGSKRQWGAKPEQHTIMKWPYGYVRGHEGYDGDEVDVYIGPNKKSDLVFVINQRQRRDRRKFDEHKVMLGFDTLAQAKKAYLDHMTLGEKMISSIRMWTIDRFKKWLSAGTAKGGPARKSLSECGDVVFPELLMKGGPFIGPRGGKWADAAHTIPWKESVSKPRGENKVTMTLWHASNRDDIKALDPSRGSEFGIYLSPRRKYSSMYGEHLYRTRVEMKNPKVVEGKHEISAKDLTKEDVAKLEAQGYDGIVVTSSTIDKASEVVAFRSNQVQMLPAPKWGRKLRHYEREDAEAEKSMLFVPLVKAQRPPPGYSSIPGGKKGGFRKRVGGKWIYWYPEGKQLTARKSRFEWGEAKWSEAQFEAGDFDRDAAHWHGYQKVKGQPPIGWTQGGVVPSSKHPVKEAGLPHRLFQIVEATAQPGWARIRDVASGETRLVEHSRVIPVFHDAKKKPPAPKPESGGIWTPGEKPPPAVSGTSGKASKIPAFPGSRAKPGTGLAAMEGGVFLRHSAREYETDESGNPVRVETAKTHVDAQTKMRLLAEFGPMLAKVAKDTQRRFGLKSRYSTEPGKRRTNETLAELRSAAMEGMLTAMERYEGGGPFSPLAKAYAQEHARLHAAREFSGGIAIPKMHARLLAKYIAAKAEAMKQEGLHDPGPEAVAKYWDIRKRDLHSGMERDDPQRSEPVPMRAYKLKVKTRVKEPGKGPKKVTLETDTKTQPGKLEWAERMHSFLTGQATAQGSEFFEDSTLVLPGVHMGAGLSAREKVEVRASIDKLLPALRQHEITIQSGRQSSTYRADSAAILERTLGLGDYEPQSAKQIAAEVPIEKKTSAGWKPLSHRQKETLVQTYLERALDRVRTGLGESRAGTLVARAKERLVPEEQVRPGPTWNQMLKARAKQIPVERVRGWRKQERDRLKRLRRRMLDRVSGMAAGKDRDHQEMLAHGVTQALRRIDRMSNREVAIKIVQSEAGRATAQTRAMQTAHIDVEVQRPGYDYGWAVVTMTDPRTGRQRRVRMRMFRAIEPENEAVSGTLSKSDEPLSAGVVSDMLRWPRLTALLYGQEGIPSTDRYIVETMTGLH